MENNEVMVILPQEVEMLAKNVSVEKRNEVQKVLNHVFNGVAKMREQLDNVEVSDENDKVNMKLANTIRLGVRQVRLDAEKEFDAKRSEVQMAMLSFKTEDALWLKSKQTMQILTKEIEENARWKEETKARFEAEQKELETQTRILKVAKFNPEIQRVEFENMSPEMFDLFLSGIEKQYNDRIEAEAKAEAERLAAIEADRLERERVLAENARLQKEAEEKERELQAERLKAQKEAEEKERELQAERLKAQQEAAIEAEKQAGILAAQIAEAKRIQDLKDAENAKLQEELKAKQDAENLAKKEAERIEHERKAAEENAAKAPIKDKLTTWVNSFEIAAFEDNQTANEITAKFEAFKKWAKSEIEKI